MLPSQYSLISNSELTLLTEVLLWALINSDAILVAGTGIEVTNPFRDDDVRVGQVILV